MRGEFLTQLGQVLPNMISLKGAETILAAAFRNTNVTFYMALVKGSPSTTMTMAEMQEPTIGVNGYSRVALPRDTTNWPNQGVIGNERYVESAVAVFTATTGNFDKTIQRMALVAAGGYDPALPVLALSAPLDSELLITPTTQSALRSFRYRVYA